MRPKNVRRARKRFTEAFGEKAAWIRRQSCAARNAVQVEVFGGRIGLRHAVCYSLSSGAPCEAAHVKSRGAGGDSTHLIPLCTHHHHEQHAVGIQTFAAKYGLDLEALAAEYERRYQEEIG